MKEAFILIAAVACLAPQMLASEASVDEIVRRHLEARGGEVAIRSIDTLVYSGGTYREPGYVGSGNAFMAFRAPFFRVVGDPEDQSSSFREGYDGSAWEWYADPGVVVRTVGAASRAARHGTNFLGPFIDYQAKGSEIALQGITSIANRPAHDLLVTLRDGFRRHYFIDTESYLIVAERYEAPVHAFGEPVRTEARFEDYREVDGVLFPFRSAEYDIATGEELNHMRWGKIEVNRNLPLSWFSPPVFPRTPIQQFLENLYRQRTDVSAVMWTYEDFKRAYLDTEIDRGIAFIGFQMVKMGSHEAAIALLESNRRDHPESADAAFALGRAYADAGRVSQAKTELRRALELDPEHRRARALLEETENGAKPRV